MKFCKGQRVVCDYEGKWELAFEGRLYVIDPDYCPRFGEVYTVEGYPEPFYTPRFIRFHELFSDQVRTVEGDFYLVPNRMTWPDDRFSPVVSKHFQTLVGAALGHRVRGVEVERMKFRQMKHRWLRTLK